MRAFGPWLAGYVADMSREVDSPGKEKRLSWNNDPRVSFDKRLRKLKTFSAGILFLYNIHTREKFTIQTNQGFEKK